MRQWRTTRGRTLGSDKRGLTLLELLVGVVISAIVSVAVGQAWTLFSRETQTAMSYSDAKAVLSTLRRDIEKNWGTRLAPDNDPVLRSFEAMDVGSTFNSPLSGDQPCQGLIIRQRDVSVDPPTVKEVRYVPSCQSVDTPILAGVPTAHPLLTCSSGTEGGSLKVTRTSMPDMIYPAPGVNYAFSLTACFRVYADKIIVELGAVGSKGKAGGFLAKTSSTLFLNDRPPQIEFLK